jgi:hypothetical protein
MGATTVIDRIQPEIVPPRPHHGSQRRQIVAASGRSLLYKTLRMARRHGRIASTLVAYQLPCASTFLGDERNELVEVHLRLRRHTALSGADRCFLPQGEHLARLVLALVVMAVVVSIQVPVSAQPAAVDLDAVTEQSPCAVSRFRWSVRGTGAAVLGYILVVRLS